MLHPDRVLAEMIGALCLYLLAARLRLFGTESMKDLVIKLRTYLCSSPSTFEMWMIRSSIETREYVIVGTQYHSFISPSISANAALSNRLPSNLD